MEAAQVAKVLGVLIKLVNELKEVEREGWNHSPRQVSNSESVADHSYGIVMLATGLFMLAPHLVLNKLRFMCMCLVHDFVEVYTDDINVHVIKDPDKKAFARARKKMLEQEAIEHIRQELGEPLGQFVYDLWMEWEENKTVEAMLGHELDAVEVFFQSVRYFESGHRVDPREFYAHARKKVSTPELVLLMEDAFKKFPPP